jgi:hypothetical protein
MPPFGTHPSTSNIYQPGKINLHTFPHQATEGEEILEKDIGKKKSKIIKDRSHSVF